MDEHAHADGSPAPSPAKPGRGGYRRGGYHGRGGARKTLARKTVVAKRGGNRGRGRGRHKTFDQPHVQSAYERTKELRELYTDVASAMKPALERLAEHTLNQMIEDPEFHTKVPEYAAIQNELDDRLEATLRRLQSEHQLNLQIVDNRREREDEISHMKFRNGFEYNTEDFYDGTINRLSILSELRRDDYGTNIPSTYTFVQEPDAVARDQGPYVFHHPVKGHEVPYPHLLADIKPSAIRTTVGRKPKPGPKRKAEDVLEGQPESKKLLGSSLMSRLRDDGGTEASTPRPRHIGGLLSARTEPDAEPESNAPSPTPLEEGLSPESSQESGNAAKKEKDLPDLPNGASEPDQWGVRTVYKRGPKANNRIVIPCVFDFDEDDIGFRDSTNDSTRKATKNSRGRFLNKPNSRAWHLDQTIVNYNVLDNKDGDLDPELVMKHKLHPKFGFFLPESINELEPPNEQVDTTRPVVVVTPDGSTLHASRTVCRKLMDNALKADRGKQKIGVMMEKLRQDLDLGSDDITTPEIRKKHEEEEERRTAISEAEEEDETLQEEQYQEPEPVPEPKPMVFATDIRTNLARQRGAARLLTAASQLDDSNDWLREIPIPNPRASRPYDAVRDIFGFTAPPGPLPLPPRHHPVDTFGLSVLADVSEDPDGYRGSSIGVINDTSMIDPSLRHGLPAPQGGFLQTALNPLPPYNPIASAQQQNSEGRPPTPARNPFTGQSTGKASPALPPLRPSRRDKGPGAGVGAGAVFMEGQPPYAASPMTLAAAPPRAQSLVPAQEYDHAQSMMPGNAGGFYPQSVHRQFHPGYSLHEQASIIPMAPMSARQGPVPAPLVIPSQQPHASQHMSSYPNLSPTLPGQAPLAPMSQMGPSPDALSQGQFGPLGQSGPPMSMNSPTSSTPRSRGSISSNNGQNNNNNSNNAKYRKIAAAPIPYNRQWPSNGGTELRLSNYDPKGAIKDYMANEPPPRTGPTTIRGWSVNNGQRNRNRAGSRKEGSVEDTESPK